MTAQEIKSNKLLFSPSPHIHCGSSVQGVMLTFIIALMPAALFSIKTYGVDALRVLTLAMASCMFFEFIILKLFNKPVTIYDGSAMLNGLILAMLLPPSVPWWLVVMGSFLTILIGKQIYGGNGCNPFNPSLIGWATLYLSWPDYLNFNIAMVKYNLPFSMDYPLSVLKKAGVSGISAFKIEDLFMGNQIGGTGSAAIFLLLLGGLFLIIRGVVNWRIPVSFLIGTALTALIFWSAGSTASPLFHIVTGNVMLGAFFLSTDFSSSPVNNWASIIYGFCCGLFIIVFRVWSVYPDGVIFAILIMNLLNPIVDKIRPGIPGRVKQTEV